MTGTYDFIIQQGATFQPLLKYSQPQFTVKPITGITKSAQAVVTATAHGLTVDWPVWIAGSLGAALGDWLSYWIGVKTLKQLELGSIRHLGAVDKRTGAPRFVAAEGGKIRNGFVVHDGGKDDPANDNPQEKAS